MLKILFTIIFMMLTPANTVIEETNMVYEMPRVMFAIEDKEFRPIVEERNLQIPLCYGGTLKFTDNENDRMVPSFSTTKEVLFSFDTTIEPASAIVRSYQVSKGKDRKEKVYHTIENVGIEDNMFYLPIQDGSYRYEVICTWDKKNYKGVETYAFDIKGDIPLQAKTANIEHVAGDVITVFLAYQDVDEEVKVTSDITDEITMYPHKEGTIVMIPVSYWKEAGQYKVKVESSKSEDIVLPIEIIEREFATQHLKMDAKVAKSTRSTAAYDEYNEVVMPVRLVSDAVQYFEGKFIQPVTGRISTEYGMYRYVNDSITSYRHSGIDYAVPLGRKVVAPNHGKVVLNKFLTLTGNTIVIDHGYGIQSLYYHLDASYVKEGQMIKKGEYIGEVGTTGSSTGPHLHFTMGYYGMNQDPEYFYRNEITLFE